MRIKWFCYCAIFLSIFFLSSSSFSDSPKIYIATVDNQIIHSATYEYLNRAIEQAEQEGAECLIIQLDTPGGLLESTHMLVKRMMNADVPIVVYVAPPGARAGSAGVFITLAGHIAAMAPSTHIGAAHPIVLGEGGGLRKLVRRIEEETAGKKREIIEEENPLTDKIMNDTLAWVENIAKTRGRNVSWAKKAVVESVSITQDEAIKEKVVDLVAENLDTLLKQIDGKKVQLPGTSKTLKTAGAAQVMLPMSGRQRLLSVIGHPNVAYLLMLFGFLGLLFEFTHPGIGFPGIGGAICLVLALYAMQVLPTNYAALFLIGLGILLLIFEVKVTSFGLLTVGGLVALTLGSLMLFDTPYEFMRVSLQVIIPVVTATAVIVLFLLNLVIRAHRTQVLTGAEGLIGEVGIAQTNLAPAHKGQVFVHGELWQAEAEKPISRGAEIKVVSVKGLKLKVELTKK